jgi:hypothetical protein
VYGSLVKPEDYTDEVQGIVALAFNMEYTIIRKEGQQHPIGQYTARVSSIRILVPEEA